MQSLRLPGALIILGFLGVVFWTIALLIPPPPTNELWVYEIATTVGYGLAGFACWRWIIGTWNSDRQWSIVRGPSRWMAAASVVTAAGVAALTYLTHRVHGGRYHHFHLAGDAAGSLGFLMAAAGFWIASSLPVQLNQNGLGPPDSPATSKWRVTGIRRTFMGAVVVLAMIVAGTAIVLTLVLPDSSTVPVALRSSPYLPAPGRQPGDVARAHSEVSTAFATVYGHGPDVEKLSLLQGGGDPAVVAAGRAAAAKFPQISAGSMPVVLRVVFTDATHAAVLYEIVYHGQPTVGPKLGSAILDGGVWMVTRATYCQDIDNAGTGMTC